MTPTRSSILRKHTSLLGSVGILVLATASVSGSSPGALHTQATAPARTPFVTRDVRLGSTLLSGRAGAFTEANTSRNGGTEQTWTFAERPTGDGDIEVRVRPEDATFDRASDAGLHFRRRGQLLSYGHGTWVDGDGRKTPVPARWDGDSVVLSVPEETVRTSRYPAVLDPFIGDAAPVNSAPTLPAVNATPVLAAKNGAAELLVWRYVRDGLTAEHFCGVENTTPKAGNVLPWAPAFVIPAGDGFLLFKGDASGATIVVAADGTVATTPGPIFAGDTIAAVAVSGSTVLIARVPTSTSIAVQRYGLDGQKLDANPLTANVANVNTFVGRVALAADGDLFAVVFTGAQSNRFIRRLRATGEWFDSTEARLSLADPGIALKELAAGGDGRFYTTFEQGNSTVVYSIPRAEAPGSTPDGPAFLPVSYARTFFKEQQAVGRDHISAFAVQPGGGVAGVWDSFAIPARAGLYTFRMTGLVLESPHVVAPTVPLSISSPLLAGSTAFWQRGPAQFAPWTVVRGTLPSTPTAAIPDPYAVAAYARGEETFPTIAHGSGTSLVTWRDIDQQAQGLGYTLRGRFLDASGVAVGPVFSLASNVYSIPSVAAAANGTDFLVSWVEGTEVAASRQHRAAVVHGDGTMSSTVTLGPAVTGSIAVAAVGTGFVLHRNTSISVRTLRRVGSDGAFGAEVDSPAKNLPGNSFLLTSGQQGVHLHWQTSETKPAGGTFARRRRLQIDGNTLAPQGSIKDVDFTEAAFLSSPSASVLGSRLYLGGHDNDNVFGRIVDLTDDTTVSTTSFPLSLVNSFAVSGCGDHWQLVGRRNKNSASLPSSVVTREIATEGTVSDESAVSVGPTHALAPSVAQTADGCVVAFTQYTQDVALQTYVRVYAPATGSGGAGGSTGQSGAGGDAGQGGANGDAGQAGAGGDAGQGGATGGAGHAGAGGDTGQAGASGDAGSAGTGGSADPGGAAGSGDAGNGGEAGSEASAGASGEGGGGTSGVAGEGGAAGKGGAAGEGGTAGKGGTPGNAGASGTAGTSGAAGNAGTSSTGGRGGSTSAGGSVGAAGSADEEDSDSSGVSCAASCTVGAGPESSSLGGLAVAAMVLGARLRRRTRVER